MRSRSGLRALLVVLLAAGAAAALLLLPREPVLGWGLGLGAVLAALLPARPARRPAGKQPKARGPALTRRAVLLMGAVAAVGAAEAVRRRDLTAVIPPPLSGSGIPKAASPAPSGSPRPAAAGLWLSPEEIAALPTETAAFERLREAADGSIEHTDISNQDALTPLRLMEVALVAARLDDDRLRGKARDVIVAVIGSEDGRTGGHPERNRPLAIGRNLPGYVISADLIGLQSFDPAADDEFSSWLDRLRTKRVKGAEWSLAEAQPMNHSNWGAHMSAAITAANIYLGDDAATQTSAECLRGWLGEPDARQDWSYDLAKHDYSWMCHYPDVDRFLPVNPAGCEREGMEIGGIIPIDMQRGAGFQVPPRFTQYPRESLQGRTVQAEMLHRRGFEAWDWADGALRRIAERQLALADEFDPEWYEPDMGCYWIIAARYGLSLPLKEPSVGRSVSGVDWTHASAGRRS